MALPFYNWSRVAASNATADATVNWAEGMAPSAVNDSGRAMMASTAAFRDDISGAIVTTGTSTDYTVTSFQVFDSLAHMDTKMIVFRPHVTNTGGSPSVTLNVDGLGAVPIRSAVGVDIPAGTLIAFTPYAVTYGNTSGSFFLHSFYGNAYNMPLAGGMDFWGTTVPNSAFAFPIGQAISRTTYSTLFAIMSTTYGVGDGSTTFNLPDKTGRVSAMKEASATRLTSTYFGGNSANMGAVGGSESHTLTAAQIPSITSAGSNSISVASVQTNIPFATANTASSASGGNFSPYWPAGSASIASNVTSTGTNSISVTSNNTSGSAHTNVQPTIVCNYIMRIL